MKINKGRIKILIICLIIIATLVVSIVFFLNKKEDNPEITAERDEYLYYEENPAQIVNGKKPIRTRMISYYSTINDCVKAYLTMVKSNNSEVVIDYLNEDFIKNNGINEKNVFNILGHFKDYDSYRTMEMYELDGDTYFEYYIKGKIDNVYVYFVVNTDATNQTFDIIPISEENYKQYLEKVAQTSEKQEKTISKKTYNFYRNAYLTNEDISRAYYIDFIKLMLTDPNQAYEMLNEEYKKAKFGNIENFKNYIRNNRNTIQMIYKVETADSSDFKSFLEYDNYIQANSDYKMKSYSVNEYNNYYQYVCGNITGSNIIFNAKYPLDYEVFMDSYTIDLPEYIEKYNTETDSNKVLMNLEKIKGAVNTRDYKYVYSKLDETFKKNNFPTQQSFEEYINKNLYEYNIFDYNNVEKKGNLYVLTTVINDATAKQKTLKSITFIVKLLGDTDFVMSFSMN